MRTCLIFMIVGWVALLAGRGYAASEQSPSESPGKTSGGYARNAEHAATASKQNRRTDKNPSTKTPVRPRAVEKNHADSHNSLTKATRPKQPSINGEHSRSGSAINLRQSGPNRSGGATRVEVIHHETLHRTQPVRPPGVVRTNAPSLSNVRHRGSNPAVIGGPASSGTRNTAALNGNQIGRRPGRN